MKRGFTLAEVLVTLGIIGVIAALTMPILVSNSKKQGMASKLAVTTNSIENSMMEILGNESENDLTSAGFASNTSMLGNYLKTIGSAPDSHSLSADASWITQNGAYIYYKSNDTTDYVGDIYIDVNGDDKPNTAGIDYFGFGLRENGTLVPMGSDDYKSNETCSSGIGLGCTATIVKNGYKASSSKTTNTTSKSENSDT
jgi:prepilin-type N-terminal cleavage/methylation domain-containing protein